MEQAEPLWNIGRGGPGERFGNPDGVDGRLNRTRQTQDASALMEIYKTDNPGSKAVCKHPNLDAEGAGAARLAP